MQLPPPTAERPASRPQTLLGIPDGPEGIRETLKIMRTLVRAWKKGGVIRDTALALVQHLAPKDWAGQIRILFYFVRDNIRYVHDVTDVETLQTPGATLEIGQGDCDDKSTLLASLLESLGHPTRFVAIARKDGNFSHVIVETKLGKKWFSLDSTEMVEPGWYPRNVAKRMVIFN